jgi:hypothetical protein
MRRLMEYGYYILVILLLIVLSPPILLWAIIELSPSQRVFRFRAKMALLKILDSNYEVEGRELLRLLNIELEKQISITDFTYMLAHLEHCELIERRFYPLIDNSGRDSHQRYLHYFKSKRMRIRNRIRPLSVVETLATIPSRFIPNPAQQIGA